MNNHVADRIENIRTQTMSGMHFDDSSQPDHTEIASLVAWAETESLVEDRLGQWDQKWYIRNYGCNTTYCIAGEICRRNNVELSLGRPYHGTRVGFWAADFRSISEVARDLLGLNAAQAMLLFDPDNTIDDLKHIAKWLQETCP